MKKAVSVLIWVLLVALLQELALRWAFPLPELRNFNRVDYRPSARMLPAERPVRSIRKVSVSIPDEHEVTHTLNYYGFRDRNWKLAAQPQTARVIFPGDSFIEGVMAADDETIPRQFQKVAAARRIRVEAMNFGVAGADLEEHVQLIADAVPWFKPDWVIMIFFANDFYGEPAQVTEKHFQRWPEGRPRLLEIVDLVRKHETPPLRWSYRRVRAGAAVPDPGNPFSDPEFERSVERLVSPRFIDAMKRGGFNPFTPGYTARYEIDLRRAVDIRGELAFIKNLISGSGGRLLVAYLPERRQITNFYKLFEKEFSPDEFDLTQPVYQAHQRELAGQCGEQGIPFLDLSAVISREEARGNHLYWKYDGHLTAIGNGVVAGALFEAWETLRNSAGPPP